MFALDPASGDTITDFVVGSDRVALPRVDADPSDDALPEFSVTVTAAGVELSFGSVTVFFEGLDALAELDTSPCEVDPCLVHPDALVADSSPFTGTAEGDKIYAMPDGGQVFGDSNRGNPPIDDPDFRGDPIAKGGNDCIIGGNGTNIFFGDSYWDVGVGGNDTMIGGDGSNTFFGDSLWDVGVGGNDTMIAGSGTRNDMVGESREGDVGIGGDDVMIGDGLFNVFVGETLGKVGVGGNDTMIGGGGINIFTGDGHGDVGVGGDDTMIGGDGTACDDPLSRIRAYFDEFGGTPTCRNEFFGDSQDGDVGVGGDDTMIGGSGDDVFVGDSDTGVVSIGGACTFVIDVGGPSGDDTIKDAGSGVIVEGVTHFASKERTLSRRLTPDRR